MITSTNNIDYQQFQVTQEKEIFYKEPTSYLDSVDRLITQDILPLLKSNGQPFIKVSRRKYAFLKNSLLINQKGATFEQYHSEDEKSNELFRIKKKGLLGEGAYKRVWDLKPLFPHLVTNQMVRTRFHWTHSRSIAVHEQLEKIKKFKNKMNSEFLLIPDSITYDASCGLIAIVQIMPKALGKDLFYVMKDIEYLSYLGKLRSIRDIALALIDMHIKNWVHLDVKPHNVLLMNQDPNDPILKLGDFDLIMKFKPDCLSDYCRGSKRYMDPKCLRRESRGLEDGKTHDQFSFGVTCYELLTDDEFRKSFKEKHLKKWVKEKDLNESPNFLKLDKRIQRIIRSCVLSSSEKRPYRLPEFVNTLKTIINQEVENISIAS